MLPSNHISSGSQNPSATQPTTGIYGSLLEFSIPDRFTQNDLHMVPLEHPELCSHAH